jgi:hypothetical protein
LIGVKDLLSVPILSIFVGSDHQSFSGVGNGLLALCSDHVFSSLKAVEVLLLIFASYNVCDVDVESLSTATYVRHSPLIDHIRRLCVSTRQQVLIFLELQVFINSFENPVVQAWKNRIALILVVARFFGVACLQLFGFDLAWFNSRVYLRYLIHLQVAFFNQLGLAAPDLVIDTLDTRTLLWRTPRIFVKILLLVGHHSDLFVVVSICY